MNKVKKFLKKYKNKILAFVCTVLCIPLFNFNAFAYDYEYHLYPVVRNTYYGGSVSAILDLDYKCDVDSSNNYYYKYNATSGTTYDCLMFGSAVDNFYYPFDLERFDYYVIGIFNLTYHDEDIPYSSEFSVDDIYYYDFYDNEYVRNKANADITYFYDNSSSAISYVFPLDNYSMLSIIEYDFLPNLVMTTRVNCQVSTQSSVLAVPKDTSVEGLSAIISAINNQTSTLGGKIDDTNDFIDKGNGSTGGIVSDNNSAIGNLDEVVSEYRATEQTFFDDFTTNQQAISSDIVGWSWGGLVNCADWVGSTLTDYYNNMGDFRQYIIYPLMLGIALFFLGRGGSIIGHLFRKPTETTVNTKSVFRREGNTRYTTTTTSRQGGVWRK